jgi:hypothetical protein
MNAIWSRYITDTALYKFWREFWTMYSRRNADLVVCYFVYSLRFRKKRTSGRRAAMRSGQDHGEGEFQPCGQSCSCWAMETARLASV